MRTQFAYCSACDRVVRVVWEPADPSDDRERLPHPSKVLCLEVGQSCTGSMCPVFGVAPAEMRERLLRQTGGSKA
ncbi:MAG: hypothetical protein HY704_10550 [Gemmatimonadetes bacterium]|nr:hypothetical protein [Gemmatimonadota bacterium]